MYIVHCSYIKVLLCVYLVYYILYNNIVHYECTVCRSYSSTVLSELLLFSNIRADA